MRDGLEKLLYDEFCKLLQNNMINGDTNSDKNNKTFFII